MQVAVRTWHEATRGKGRMICLESKQKCQPGGAWARSRHAVSEVPLLPTGKEKSVIGRLSKLWRTG